MTSYVVFVCSEKGQVNSMNTIQDLYYGRISPYEMSISTAPEYQKLKALADKNENLLKETLSDEQKELLEKLTESITDISSISERDMFIAGFRLGMKLMIDVTKDEYPPLLPHVSPCERLIPLRSEKYPSTLQKA